MAHITEEQLRYALLARRDELREDLSKLQVQLVRRQLEKDFGLDEKSLDCQRDLISDLVQELIVGMPTLDGRGLGSASKRDYGPALRASSAPLQQRPTHFDISSISVEHTPVNQLLHMGRHSTSNPFFVKPAHATHRSKSVQQAHKEPEIIAFRQSGTGTPTRHSCTISRGDEKHPGEIISLTTESMGTALSPDSFSATKSESSPGGSVSAPTGQCGIRPPPPPQPKGLLSCLFG